MHWGSNMSGFVVDWSDGVMDSHGALVMRGGNSVHGFMMHWGRVVNWSRVVSSRMGSLVVDRGSMMDGGSMDCLMNHGGLVVGLQLLGHEFLIHCLGNFDIFDAVLLSFVNSFSGVDRLVMNWGSHCVYWSFMNWGSNCVHWSLMSGGLNISDLRLIIIRASVLWDLDVSGTGLVARFLNDIADGALGVSRLRNITRLSVHGLLNVAWLSILRSDIVCIVRSVGFFGRGVGRSKGGANERKSSHCAKCWSSVGD